MGKLLIGLGAVVAAAAIAWALWPASAPAPVAAKPAPASAAPPSAARLVVKTLSGAPTGPRPLRVPERTDPARGQLQIPAMAQPAPAAHPAAAAQEAEGAPPAMARPVDSAMPRITYRDLKNSVRRFYGSVPASGRLSGPVYAEDVLPGAVLAQLNVPPHSRLTMVDHFQAEDAAGYKSVLDMDERYQSSLGLSFVTPDGRPVRDYVSVQPQP